MCAHDVLEQVEQRIEVNPGWCDPGNPSTRDVLECRGRKLAVGVASKRDRIYCWLPVENHFQTRHNLFIASELIAI